MTDTTIAAIDALQHIQSAITVLSDVHKKDTEIISAIRDLENAKGRMAEVLWTDIMKNR